MEYKVVILGSGSVGKSALVVRYHRGAFLEKYDPTIEDSYKKPDDVDGKGVMLDILDTAGQEEFSTLRSQYMEKGQGFMLVYAINSKKSFESLKGFFDQLYQTKGKDPTAKCIPIVLCGNKCDLESEREVTREEAEKLAAEWGPKCAFFETSAKNNVNVTESFRELVRKINNSDFKPKPPPKKGGFCTIL